MDTDSEVRRISERAADQRPPSSYGSMCSEEEDDDEEMMTDTTSQFLKPTAPSDVITGIQLTRSDSPETLLTEWTQQQSVKQGAYLTGSIIEEGLEEEAEDEEEDEDGSRINSPEPPPPVEPEEESQDGEETQPGRLHPDFDLPFIFKNMQSVLSNLSQLDLMHFKRRMCNQESRFAQSQLLELDVLDLVDKLIESLGMNCALQSSIRVLEYIKKDELANELKTKCRKVWMQYELKTQLIQTHEIIREGVPRPGQQRYLNAVYVEPLLSLAGHGGVHPAHEARPHPPSPPPLPGPDTHVGLHDVFRLRGDDGEPVKTVVTTGIAGIGMSVSVQKFCLDWAQNKTNKDIQFLFSFSFRALRNLRNRKGGEDLSFMELIEYFHHECRDVHCLDEPDCRYLIVMDCLDMYKDPLDFQEIPVLSDIHTKAPLDALLVNLIRGDLLPRARLWILGRRGATGQIPPQYIDRTVEIQGFSEEKKDEFWTKRYQDKELASRVVRQARRCPSLLTLCHMPFPCWMAAAVLEREFRDPDYGGAPPKLTPFYVHYLIVQTNRSLEKYRGAGHDAEKWSDSDKERLMTMGKMALRMLERNASVFFQEDLEEHGLALVEVVVQSGLCTEIPTAGTASQRRRFTFVHLTVQEFMAALYAYITFRLEGRNVLESPGHLRVPKKISAYKDRPVLELYRPAADRALASPPGHLDMFLRFLCGLSVRVNEAHLLRGLLLPHRHPPPRGLEDVVRLVEQRRDGAPAERVENLRECLRELTQEQD